MLASRRGAVRVALCRAPAPTQTRAGPLPSPVAEIVARVNGEPVRILQVLPLAKAELDRVSVAERDRRKPVVIRRALAQYVDRELLLQEALARGVSADWSLPEGVPDHQHKPGGAGCH